MQGAGVQVCLPANAHPAMQQGRDTAGLKFSAKQNKEFKKGRCGCCPGPFLWIKSYPRLTPTRVGVAQRADFLGPELKKECGVSDALDG